MEGERLTDAAQSRTADSFMREEVNVGGISEEQ